MKKSIYISLFAMLFSLTVYSQSEYYTGKIWIIVNDDLLIPTVTRNSSDAEFAQILSDFGIQLENISRPMSFAKTPELQRLYELNTVHSEDSLFAQLTLLNNSRNGTLFYSIEKCPIPQPLSGPADHFWQLTLGDPEDWLWYLLKIQALEAWQITKGCEDVKVAVTDIGLDPNHPDLIGKISPPYHFYSGTPFNNPGDHGTGVSTILAGETVDAGETANGQMASIGYNTKIMYENAGVTQCVYASTVLNANILSLSWYFGCSPNASFLLAEQEILENGTVIIRAAGNGTIHCNGQRLYPFSGFEDERTIVITSTGVDDKHYSSLHSTSNSHYPEVDLCAPGYRILCGSNTQNGDNPWPYYHPGGTSQSTPIVSGTAALMHCVNPCLTSSLTQDILKNTTDPIVDANNFPGVVGTGRLNTFKAVQAAQNSYSPELDLYIKDRLEDFGNEVYPYHWQADRDKSPDIWVRNQNDGYTNMTHQEPEYSSVNPSYIYVRVWNKSCEDAAGDEKLRLYWTKAGTMTSWPQNWDGTDPNIGNLVGEIPIGELKAGHTKIYEFTWNILNPYIHQNWATCLLARIEDSATDLITIHPNNASDDVYFNNNIALRNVTITDIYPGILNPIGVVDGIYHPHGKYIFIGNANPVGETFDFTFNSDEDDKIKDFAEVKLIFDNEGWAIMKPFIINNPDFRIMREREVILVKDSAVISGVEFAPNKRIPVFVGFSFLAEHSELEHEFDFHVRQYHSNNQRIIGGEHFIINKGIRPSFYADAGNDKEVDLGQTVVISAQEITELAIYNWYDEDGNLIHTGREFALTPEITKKYNLELIAISDGSKAYDEIKVEVKKDKIISMSPNPASNIVNIEYLIDDNSSSYLMIINQTATQSNNYILNSNSNSISIALDNYNSGLYTVVLISSGIVVDAKHLIID